MGIVVALKGGNEMSNWGKTTVGLVATTLMAVAMRAFGPPEVAGGLMVLAAIFTLGFISHAFTYIGTTLPRITTFPGHEVRTSTQYLPFMQVSAPLPHAKAQRTVLLLRVP